MATKQLYDSMSLQNGSNAPTLFQTIVDMLTGGGWVQTSDTGQTTAASMSTSTTADALLGYQIWKMNDSLQATAPVFLKIENANGSSGGGTPVFSPWFTTGTGSDGAGNITGVMTPRTQMRDGRGGNGASTATAAYWCSSTNRFIWAGVSGTNAGTEANLLFSVERTVDTNGTPTGDGVMVCMSNFNVTDGRNTAVYQVGKAATGTYANSTKMGVFMPSGSTLSDNYLGLNNVGCVPFRFFTNAPTNPGTQAMVYMNGDTAARQTGVANPTPTQVQLYGTTRYFLPLGSHQTKFSANNNANEALMMLWE